jgi:hypothetical protein
MYITLTDVAWLIFSTYIEMLYIGIGLNERTRLNVKSGTDKA